MYWGCRKAAATAFSTANMRAQFPNIRTACSQLIEVLKGVGPGEVVDMDNALCRESLDVIGEIGSQPACLTKTLAGSACQSELIGTGAKTQQGRRSAFSRS